MLSRISQFSGEVKNWLLFKKKKTAQKTEVMRAISKMRSRAMQVLAFSLLNYEISNYYKWKILNINVRKSHREFYVTFFEILLP